MTNDIERQEKLDRARAARDLVRRRWAKSDKADRANSTLHMRSFKLINKNKPKPITDTRAIGQGCYKCSTRDCARCICYCHSA